MLTTHATSQTMEIGLWILDSFKNDVFCDTKKNEKKILLFDIIEILYKNKVYEDSLNVYSFQQI